MAIPSIKFEITSSIVGAYGAIVATVGLVISIFNYFRDRAKIVIVYGLNYYVKNMPGYDPRKQYIAIDVINRGRRPVRLGNAAFKALSPGSLLINDSLLRPVTLTEENPKTTFLIEQDGVDLNKMWYIVVYDAAGRQYRKYLTHFPTFRRFKNWLKDRKQKIAGD